MTVFDDLKAIKKYNSLFPYGKATISKEQYNALMNDKRTFKERFKDTIKILKKLEKILKINGR